MRQQFAQTTETLMVEDSQIVVLSGDIGTFQLRHCFARFPDRTYNLGTAEQAMVSIGAGLAKEGFYPIIHSFSGFLLRRAYEQIYLDFGIQKLGGLFVGIGQWKAGGASHICNDDMELAQCAGMETYWPESKPTLDGYLRNIIRNRRFAYVRV